MKKYMLLPILLYIVVFPQCVVSQVDNLESNPNTATDACHIKFGEAAPSYSDTTDAGNPYNALLFKSREKWIFLVWDSIGYFSLTKFKDQYKLSPNSTYINQNLCKVFEKGGFDVIDDPKYLLKIPSPLRDFKFTSYMELKKAERRLMDNAFMYDQTGEVPGSFNRVISTIAEPVKGLFDNSKIKGYEEILEESSEKIEDLQKKNKSLETRDDTLYQQLRKEVDSLKLVVKNWQGSKPVKNPEPLNTPKNQSDSGEVIEEPSQKKEIKDSTQAPPNATLIADNEAQPTANEEDTHLAEGSPSQDSSRPNLKETDSPELSEDKTLRTELAPSPTELPEGGLAPQNPPNAEPSPNSAENSGGTDTSSLYQETYNKLTDLFLEVSTLLQKRKSFYLADSSLSNLQKLDTIYAMEKELAYVQKLLPAQKDSLDKIIALEKELVQVRAGLPEEDEINNSTRIDANLDERYAKRHEIFLARANYIIRFLNRVRNALNQ